MIFFREWLINTWVILVSKTCNMRSLLISKWLTREIAHRLVTYLGQVLGRDGQQWQCSRCSSQSGVELHWWGSLRGWSRGRGSTWSRWVVHRIVSCGSGGSWLGGIGRNIKWRRERRVSMLSWSAETLCRDIWNNHRSRLQNTVNSILYRDINFLLKLFLIQWARSKNWRLK